MWMSRCCQSQCITDESIRYPKGEKDLSGPFLSTLRFEVRDEVEVLVARLFKSDADPEFLFLSSNSTSGLSKNATGCVVPVQWVEVCGAPRKIRDRKTKPTNPALSARIYTRSLYKTNEIRTYKPRHSFSPEDDSLVAYLIKSDVRSGNPTSWCIQRVVE